MKLLIADTAGIVAPSVTGFMIQATGGSYAGAFVLAGGIAVIGGPSEHRLRPLDRYERATAAEG